MLSADNQSKALRGLDTRSRLAAAENQRPSIQWEDYYGSLGNPGTRCFYLHTPPLIPEAWALEPGNTDQLPPTSWATSGTTFTLPEPQLPCVRNGGESHILKLCRLSGLNFVNAPGTVSDLEEGLRQVTY